LSIENKKKYNYCPPIFIKNIIFAAHKTVKNNLYYELLK